MLLEISEQAKERLINVLTNGQSLVVSVVPGGCNGFSYKYEISSKPPEHSTQVSQSPSVYILDSAKDMLLGGVLQYKADELGTSFFSITNPNATSKCGCGHSFSTF